MQKFIRFVVVLLGLGWLLAGPAVASPSLPFIGAVYDSSNLDEVTSLAFSADGRYLYTVGESSSVLAVFSRDETTGMLSLVDRQRDDAGPVDGLGGASAVALSPDGGHVYVVGQYDDAVATFSRNETSGKLRFVDMEQNQRNTMIGLNGAASVTVSPDGRHVYTASLYDSAVTAFSRDEVAGTLNFIEVEQNGQDGVVGLGGTRWVTVSPDGRYLYAAGPVDNAVAIFGRNETTGTLSFIKAEKDGQNGVDGLAGVGAIAISPDGRYLYTTGQNDHAVAIFNRNETTGALSFIKAEKDGQNGVDGLAGARSLMISPDGRSLYVTSTIDDAIAFFNRNEVTGRLSFVEVHKDGQQGVDGLNGAGSIAVSADGLHLYVAGMSDNAIATFSRDDDTGKLSFVEVYKDGRHGMDGLLGARSVAVSPDGRYVYTAAAFESAAAVFSRDGTTGRLSFVEVHRDGERGVDGLHGAGSIAVSPNGRYLYVAGSDDNAIAVFWRFEDTGEMIFAGVEKDSLNGVEGLEQATGVTVSPDGRHVYVAGPGDDAVTIFLGRAGGEPIPVYLPMMNK